MKFGTILDLQNLKYWGKFRRKYPLTRSNLSYSQKDEYIKVYHTLCGHHVLTGIFWAAFVRYRHCFAIARGRRVAYYFFTLDLTISTSAVTTASLCEDLFTLKVFHPIVGTNTGFKSRITDKFIVYNFIDQIIFA